MSKRKIYDVMPAGNGAWKVVYTTACYTMDKKSAVAEARYLAKREWKESKRPTQVRVRNEKGRIQYENTYGKDPKRRKG